MSESLTFFTASASTGLSDFFFVNFTVGAVNRRAIKIDPALVSLQADHQNHL